MVAVVSHRTWQSLLAGDEQVVGRTIRLNNQPVTIIGVGPSNFNGEAGALLLDFWLSISSTPVGGPYQVTNLSRREDHWYQVKARLAPGVSLAAARASMATLAQRMGELYPDLDRGRDITVFAHDEIRFHPDVDAELVPIGAGLLTVAGLVLLLACTNLANLVLARGSGRQHELAVRRALGASRMRLIADQLAEAWWLAAMGAVGAFVVARLLIVWFTSARLPISEAFVATIAPEVDGSTVLLAAGAVLASLLVFGLAPAIYLTRVQLRPILAS